MENPVPLNVCFLFFLHLHFFNSNFIKFYLFLLQLRFYGLRANEIMDSNLMGINRMKTFISCNKLEFFQKQTLKCKLTTNFKRTTSIKLTLSILMFAESVSMKKILYFGQFFLDYILMKSRKTICNLNYIFKCLIGLGKRKSLGEGGRGCKGKFHVWTKINIHFIFSRLIFIRIWWPEECPSFMGALDFLHDFTIYVLRP